MTITLQIYGDPVAKGRARVFRDKARNTRAVTPEKTRKWEDSIKLQAIEQMRGKQMIEGAIGLTLHFYRSRPKSLAKKRWHTAMPTTRPDLDNYIKAVKDALNGIVWRDDSQIITLIASKYYGDRSGVLVEIAEFTEG